MEIRKLIMFLSLTVVIITSITLITGLYALRIGGGGGGRPAAGGRPGGGAPGARPGIDRPGRPGDGSETRPGIGRPGRPGGGSGIGQPGRPGGRPGGDGRPGRPDHRPGRPDHRPGRPGHHGRPGKDVNIFLGGAYGFGYPYYGSYYYNGYGYPYGYSATIGPFYAYLTAQQAELPSVYCPQACKYSPDNPGKSWTGQSFWDDTYGFTCVCA